MKYNKNWQRNWVDHEVRNNFFDSVWFMHCSISKVFDNFAGKAHRKNVK